MKKRGRPRLNPPQDKNQLNVWIPDHTEAAIRAIAADNYWSIGRVIVIAIALLEKDLKEEKERRDAQSPQH